jgi:hypothetical protein
VPDGLFIFIICFRYELLERVMEVVYLKILYHSLIHWLY